MIRPIAADSAEEVAWVAQRMRATLVEVLGQERGEAMYTLDWLDRRVRFHLDASQCQGQVFIWVEPGRQRQGYTIVRREGPGLGLFSTTFVEESGRRRGVAGALVEAGEVWMRQQGLGQAATYTADHNLPLQRLFIGRGYCLTTAENGFVKLSRQL